LNEKIYDAEKQEQDRLEKMDNKKLMHILLHDVSELEQLIAEIRNDGSFDAIDMELLHTRISGVRHLLEIAGDVKDQPKETAQVPEKLKPISVILTEEKAQPEDVSVQKIKVKKEDEPVVTHEEKIKPAGEPIFASSMAEEVLSEKEVLTPLIEREAKEEFKETTEKPILADKFVAGKSVNDILLEKSKNDSRISNMAINSLASAIGTNERFLFTRELFEGNMESFNDTINRLDNMHGIREAADFLRENFKWQKSETSLRFIDLVKRRFVQM